MKDQCTAPKPPACNPSSPNCNAGFNCSEVCNHVCGTTGPACVKLYKESKYYSHCNPVRAVSEINREGVVLWLLGPVYHFQFFSDPYPPLLLIILLKI